MTHGPSIQSDFSSVVSEIGQNVTVFQVLTSGNNYDTYGEFLTSGGSLYISGVSTTAFFQTRTDKDLDLQNFGQRIDGNVAGYFESGVSVAVGCRVSGIMVGDFKVNAINNYFVGSVLCYTMAVLDTMYK